MPDVRSRIPELLAKHEPLVRDAFLQAVDEIVSQIVIADVVRALERGDVQGAIDAMRIEPAAYRALERALEAAFEDGGGDTANALTGMRSPTGDVLQIRFDVRNPAAEQWLRQDSSTRVTRIVEDQREAIRVRLTERMSQGVNPRTMALDIVGRVDNKRPGQPRVGGIVGLSAPQERYASNARDELLSGDPARMQNYLTRERRDKRFDRVVLKAIREGKPVSIDDVQKIITRYEAKLKQLRGETIARTETIKALNEAREQAFRQAVASGQVPASAIRKIWNSAADARVRDTHIALNGESVQLDAAFASPSGAMLKYPGDTSLGAGAGEIINCRCIARYRIDWLANLS